MTESHIDIPDDSGAARQSRPRLHAVFLRLGEWALVGLVLLIITLAVARVYWADPLWPKNFGLHDDRYLFGPNAFYLDTALEQGEFPLWNPLVYCGTPFAAEPETTAFYPPHLLRSLLTPAYDPYATAVSLQVMLLFHVLACGLGVYVWAREYGLSPWAGLAGGLAYMLSPFSIIYSTEFYIYTLAFAWGPWVLWLVHRALKAETPRVRLRRGALAALAFGASLLGVFPQLTLYLVLMMAFYVTADRLLRPRDPGAMSYVQTARARLWQSSRFTGAILLLGVLVGAVALFPVLEFGRLSGRAASAGLEVQPWKQDLGLVHLLKCLVIFPGNTWLPQGCRAAGIGSLIVALGALGSRRREVWVLLGLFLFMTDLTLGPPAPFATMLRAVDVGNITVSPWRAGIYASLCFSMLVAFGIDGVTSCGRRLGGRLLLTGTCLAAGVGMLALLASWLADEPLLDPGFLGWLVPLLTLVAVVAFIWMPPPHAGRAVLSILVATEIVLWAGVMLPAYVTPRLGGRSTDGFGETRQLWQANHRSAVPKANWNMWTLSPATNGYGPVYLARTRKVLCHPALESTYRIGVRDNDVQAHNQRGNLFLKRSFWLARQWVAGPLPGKAEVFPAATTLFLAEQRVGEELPVPEVPRDKVVGQAVSAETERIDLGDQAALAGLARRDGKEVALALPRCATNFQHSVLYLQCAVRGAVAISGHATSEDNQRVALYAQTLRPEAGARQEVAIPLPDAAETQIRLIWPVAADRALTIESAYVLRDAADEDRHLAITRRRPNGVAVQLTDLPAPRLLLFVDAAYPGWRAEVDGNPVPILLANDGFKAVLVPDGTHTVQFELHAPMMRAGLIVSSGTTIVLLVVIFGTVFWRRKAKEA